MHKIMNVRENPAIYGVLERWARGRDPRLPRLPNRGTHDNGILVDDAYRSRQLALRVETLISLYDLSIEPNRRGAWLSAREKDGEPIPHMRAFIPKRDLEAHLVPSYLG